MVLLFFLFFKEWKHMYNAFHKNIKKHNCFQHRCFLTANQFISMFFEGLCDTGDWRNDAENSVLTTEINYTLKHIQIRKQLF